MTDELRTLAGAVRYIATNGWLDDDDLVSIHPIFSTFIAAASPSAVLALLDERDEARAAVKRLAGALESVGRECQRSTNHATKLHGVQSWVREAMADPVVKRIVEE